MKLPDFEAWAIFASVVEHRSFSGAATVLGLSKSTVSKAVSRLEVQLGQALFHRTSRKLTLTEDGRLLALRAQRLLADGIAAEEAARNASEAPRGLVRIAAPMTFGLMHVAPVIAEFLESHPGIEVDLHLSDARTDIVAEGFDLALRIAELPDSSLRARRLGAISASVVAAPSYLSQRGTPIHPGQLADHDCFAYSNNRAPWRFNGPDGAEIFIRPSGSLTTNSGEAMLPALRAGIGVAILPDFIVEADLASGMLVPILTEWQSLRSALHILTPPGTLRPVRVEAVIDHLSDRLRRVCSSGRSNADKNLQIMSASSAT